MHEAAIWDHSRHFLAYISCLLELRDLKNTVEYDKNNICFICNLDRQIVEVDYPVRQKCRWIRKPYKERPQALELPLLLVQSEEERSNGVHWNRVICFGTNSC